MSELRLESKQYGSKVYVLPSPPFQEFDENGLPDGGALPGSIRLRVEAAGTHKLSQDAFMTTSQIDDLIVILTYANEVAKGRIKPEPDNGF